MQYGSFIYIHFRHIQCISNKDYYQNNMKMRGRYPDNKITIMTCAVCNYYVGEDLRWVILFSAVLHPTLISESQ